MKRATERPAKRALTPDDARTLLEALRDERNGAMFALSLRVGLRPSEAAALWWDDLNGNVLQIRRGVRIVHGNPSVVEALKTDPSRRAIELPADLAAWSASTGAISGSSASPQNAGIKPS